MVDYLYRYTPGLGLVERPGGVTVESGPCVFVDLGLEGGFQSLVGVVCTQEVGMADEEAFLVVVGIDKPASNALGTIAADLAGVRVKNIYSIDFDLIKVISGQWRVDSDFIKAFSILLISVQAFNKFSDSGVARNLKFTDKIRNVSSSASEPRAMPSD